MTVTLYHCHHCHNTLYPPREVTSPYVEEDTARDYFCSDQCYENALDNFIPVYFKQGTPLTDYPHTQRAILKDFKSSLSETYDEMLRKECIKIDKEKAREEEEQRRAEEKREQEWDKDYVAAAYQHQQFLAKEQEMKDKQAELIQRQWEKDYLAAEKEHEKFLADEAFQESLESKPIPQHIRYEHTHIIGGSGSGKTSLIQQLLMEDFMAELPLPMAIVVIDPKGEMVDRISRLIAFDPFIVGEGWSEKGKGWLADNLIVIDPTQQPLPALDLFHQPPIPMNEQQRARVRTHLIDTFAYIFSTAGAKLTQRQSIPFGYVVRLVFSMSGNIDTLMDILEDNPKERRFFPHMQKLGKQDRGAQRFFENDFYSTGFSETRQQIKTRLYEIISRPELMAMFAAGQNKLSMFDCLQQHKIVLVNTAMPQLGAAVSQLLGRYFIAMTLNAAFARFAIPKSQWTPAYLIIDEFQDFADEEMTPKMLRLAREYKLGITIAHQNPHCAELNDAIRNAISTNTSIKYAASPEGNDLGYMARDMRCDPDFLKTMTKHGDIANFACYARGMGLTHPFVYDVELGKIDTWDKIDEDRHALFMSLLRDQLKADPQQTPHVSVHSPPDGNKPTPSAPETHKPRRESDTPTQPPAKSPPTDSHTGDHTEPTSKWGDE